MGRRRCGFEWEGRVAVGGSLLLALAAMIGWPPSVVAVQGNEFHSNGTSFGYRYESSRFHISLIEIDLAPDGRGELRFKRGESDDIISRQFKLLPETAGRIGRLFDETGFLGSDHDYQDKKDFSHLGWTTLWIRSGERERSTRFNYTTEPLIRELAEIMRGVAAQEMHVFDLELAERYQPLDLPKRLEILENDLRLQRITEPLRLLPPLQEIAGSDVLPLIARNHAARIIKSIEKNRFKSPVKK